MEPLVTLSLGAGVQSTTMALMAAKGELDPAPSCAIFADTGWEPKKVYDHLDWLEQQLPFPVHRVSGGNLRDSLVSQDQKHYASVPFFLLKSDGTHGMGRRSCTYNHKILPLQKKLRELLGYEPRKRIPPGSAISLIGITIDEAVRMKPSRVRWVESRWPLIDKRMSRHDCLMWMERNGYPEPPKSACIGCPFHNDAMWRWMKDNDPESWADAVEVEKALPSSRQGLDMAKTGTQQFMHPRRIPLEEVDLTTLEDHGQLNLFENECEGMCGV